MLLALLAWLIIGGVAGWIAGTLVEGTDRGIFGDVLVGVAGAMLGGLLAKMFGLHIAAGFLSALVLSTIGACAFLWLLRVVKSE
jgi:uncharacterized membrane protein YeaQ/YmgE (transglycosylase-associated protein family)